MRPTALVLAIATATTPLAAQAPSRDTVATLLATGAHPWLGNAGRFVDVQGMVSGAVIDGGAASLAAWTRDGRASSAARAVLALVTASHESTPDERADAARLDSIARGRLDDTQRSLFGLAMHVVVARHAAVRAQGRLDPARLHAEWSLAPQPVALAPLVAAMQGDASTVADGFAALEPQTPHYRRLRQALEAVRALRADSVALVLPSPAKPVKPGQKSAGLRDLGRLLVALGELPATARPDTVTYDTTLARAVQRIRRRTDRKATTVLDAATVARLAAQLDDRERALSLAMERWRWLPRQYANTPLVVNIPEFRLERWVEWAGDSAGGIAMNVVVGRADSNATPVFASSLTQVVFSPQWRVPTSIMRKEIGPRAVKNPGYLARNNYYLASAGGTELPVTGANIARIGTGVFVRQRSGGGNSLGRVKFNMYNPYDIYMHDTPSKRLFARPRRDFSHGCVRLANPTALARFVLADQPAWTDERIDEAMKAGKERFVGLRKSIPVLIVYHTLVVEPDGTMRRFDDIYGHDARAYAALAGGRPVAAAMTEEAAP
ncbi:MAG: L,D-transpeptidase family protein [Gemmatimonadaceae bacterium]|nr:L,D-transpeptidase family protein [Gemmatimonadaceae bacterium]